MPTIRNEQDGIDIGNSHPFREWLQVLARPAVFRSLARLPSRAHLLDLLDAYEPFARSRVNDGGPFTKDGGSLALELANQMRVHLSAWSPPGLPAEIVATARALLGADGCYAVLDWEKGPDLDPGQTIDDIVIWPPWKPVPR